MSALQICTMLARLISSLPQYILLGASFWAAPLFRLVHELKINIALVRTQLCPIVEMPWCFFCECVYLFYRAPPKKNMRASMSRNLWSSSRYWTNFDQWSIVGSLLRWAAPHTRGIKVRKAFLKRRQTNKKNRTRERKREAQRVKNNAARIRILATIESR
jgi:hypothetical protein